MNSRIVPSTRAGKITALVAGGSVVTACVVAGVLIATAPASDNAPAAAPSATVAEVKPQATPEQAYQLSLPALDTWLADDFENSWIVASATLARVGHALDYAALHQDSYAQWVLRFEAVVAIADAIEAGDEAAAQAAFAPLLAEEPGPYVDAVIDNDLPRDPGADADMAIDELDAAIAAGDRDAARQAAADAALAIAHMVRVAQVTMTADTAPQALGHALPALHALDDIQNAVVDGQATDAVAPAAALSAAFDEFRAWYDANDAN